MFARRSGWMVLGWAWGFGPPALGLPALDDRAPAEIAGRDGLTIVTAGGEWRTSSVDYSQDGQTLSLKGWSRRSVAGLSDVSATTIDAVGDQLQMTLRMATAVYSFDDAVFLGQSKGFGGMRLYTTAEAQWLWRPGGSLSSSGLGLDGSRITLVDSTFYHRSNGFDLIAKGGAASLELKNAFLELVTGATGDEIRLGLGNSRLAAGLSGVSVDLAYGDPAIGVPVTPGAPDTRYVGYAGSVGRFSLDAVLGGSLSLVAGGANTEGLRIKPDLSLSGGVLQYQDDGVLRAGNLSASLRSSAGLTVDLEQDAAGPSVKLAASDLQFSAALGSLTVGHAANQKLGSLGWTLNFADAGTLQNWVKLRPGGDANAGSQGLNADLSWNLGKSDISLVDNGNGVWFSGLRSNGTGRVSLNLTKSCAGGVGTGCFAGTQSDMSLGSYNGHFDGLRIGLSNVRGSYRFDGLRVGSATAPLQGGTELLLLLGVHPAQEFTLNGQLTLLPGGSTGDGLGFNADLFATAVNAALTLDETGKGLWLSDATVETHVRNGSLDITSAGLELRSGESWSKLDARDLRWGAQVTGASLGRMQIKRYEQGSLLSLATGGAGALCIGATASSAAACGSAGGRWEDRGDEGLTLRLKSVFLRDSVIDSQVNGVATDEKRNQWLLETGRSLDLAGKAINGSGVQLVLDNFFTSDGNVLAPSANSYGFNVDLNVDVAPTVVTDKTTPSVVATPLGFAVNGRVQFKELGVDRVQTVHPSGGAQSALFGLRLQNVDMRITLTATPIR